MKRELDVTLENTSWLQLINHHLFSSVFLSLFTFNLEMIIGIRCCQLAFS